MKLFKRKYAGKHIKEPVTIMAALIMLVIVGMTICFSSFSDTELISGPSAVVRVQKDIRVTGVSVTSPVGGAISSYEEYTATSISSSLELPSSSSTLTYQVQVMNLGNVEMVIKEITGLPANLKYTISPANYKLDEMVCDDSNSNQCTLGATKTINITIGYETGGYDSSNTTYPFSLNFRFEQFNKVAQIGSKYYQSLQGAIDAVPTTNVETTVRLLQNSSEIITVAKNKKIVFDFGNNTLSNYENNPVISNNGTITISNGTVTSNATQGAINNESTGKITINGGRIIATGTRQALYNNKGNATITGNAYLTATSTARAAVQNVSGGTMTITGGTIISTGFSGVVNAGTMTIGEKDGNVNTSSPMIRGIDYGINATANLSFYDGIIKGKTAIINNVARITDKETGYDIINTEEVIDGDTYKVGYLGITILVTFDPNGGTVTEASRNVSAGMRIGTLPEPIRTGHEFLGWYTDPDPDSGDLITANTIINAPITFYAHWEQITEVAQIVGGAIYDTVQAAINAVPSNTPKTIKLLKNVSENVKIQSSAKNITFDFNGKTLSNLGNSAVMTIDNGNVTLTNGTLASSADYAAINMNGGNLTVSSGRIIATGTRQTIYITGGTTEITGTAYLSSSTYGTPTNTTMERGAVQNLTGTLIVTGGTIVGTKQQAISNEGTLTIGTKDGSINSSSPVLIGEGHGIKNAGTLNFYDGIVKGKTDAISGTITDQETNSRFVNGTEVIDGKTYITQSLELIP